MTSEHTMFGMSALLVVTVVGCAAHEPQTAPPPPPVAAVAVSEAPGEIVGEQAVKRTAKVIAIDHKHRIVTLRGPDGNVVDVEIAPEVQNLRQVKKGDEVVATYYESIAVSVRKPGEAKPGVSTADDVRIAQPGEKPSRTTAHQTTVTATIVGLDKRKSTATLKGPGGKTVEVKVKDPKRLENVAVGDLVEVVYTQALAISVEKPSAEGHSH